MPAPRGAGQGRESFPRNGVRGCGVVRRRRPNYEEFPMRGVASRLALCLSVLVLPSVPARAERKVYVPDRAHCQLNFVGEALLLSAHGYFEKWEIDTQLNAANLEDSSVQLQIESASLNTRIEQRDKHLRSADFLDVANHPQIKFVSTRVKKVDDKTVTVTGNLTLRGVTKQV